MTALELIAVVFVLYITAVIVSIAIYNYVKGRDD